MDAEALVAVRAFRSYGIKHIVGVPPLAARSPVPNHYSWKQPSLQVLLELKYTPRKLQHHGKLLRGSQKAVAVFP